jgi:hypothetical protein
MSDKTISGTNVDQGEVDAVFAALKQEADTEISSFYRHMISDDFLRAVAENAVAASVKYRTAPSI